MFGHMRFAAADMSADNGISMLGSSVMRAMEAGLNPFEVNNLRTLGFRALAPLVERAQVTLDNAVISVGRERLAFIDDLISEGLTFPLPGAMGIPFLEHNTQNRVGTARRVMNPSARGEKALPKMTPGRIPIYLTMADFELDIRTLESSRRQGLPLDTTMIENDTRAVNEAVEDAGINGATTFDGQNLQVDGYTAPGLLNAPNANTATLTLAAWVTAPVGDTVFSEILAMITKLKDDKKYGPYNLYVPTTVMIALNKDFKANGNDSILARIEKINVGGRPLRVRGLDLMPSTKVALVQMTKDVVRLIDGQRPTVIPYTSQDGFVLYNVVMAIQVPQFRSDYDGNSGVVIGTLQ